MSGPSHTADIKPFLKDRKLLEKRQLGLVPTHSPLQTTSAGYVLTLQNTLQNKTNGSAVMWISYNLSLTWVYSCVCVCVCVCVSKFETQYWTLSGLGLWKMFQADCAADSFRRWIIYEEKRADISLSDIILERDATTEVPV